MSYKVIFAPSANRDLVRIFDYISAEAGAAIAELQAERIHRYCEGFSTFPMRGMARDDMRPGLRLVGFRRQATIAFMVTGDIVQIIRVFYGGQNVAFDETEE